MGMTPAKYLPSPTPYGGSPNVGAIGAPPVQQPEVAAPTAGSDGSATLPTQLPDASQPYQTRINNIFKLPYKTLGGNQS